MRNYFQCQKDPIQDYQIDFEYALNPFEEQMLIIDNLNTLFEEENQEIQVKGRNSRKPKKANHGARPCSSYMRRMKQKGWYKPERGND